MLGRSGSLRAYEFEIERNSYAACDLVLHGEQIARVAVEPLGPHMHVGLGINELSVDANPVPDRRTLPSNT